MTQLTPIRGFKNTPVSKSICILSTLGALFVSIFEYKHYLNLTLSRDILEYRQYWRILLSQLSVINESDYMITMFLWFHYKNLERYFGTRKYLSMVIVFYFYNAIFCLGLRFLGRLIINAFIYLGFSIFYHYEGEYQFSKTIFDQVVPGPLGILSSLYICYGTYIPVSYIFRILLSNPKDLSSSDEAVNEATNEATSDASDENTEEIASTSTKKRSSLILTNHFQINIIYTILLLNNGFQSIIPCLVGLMVGKLYCQDLLPGARSWMVPVAIHAMITSPKDFSEELLHRIQRRIHGDYTQLNNGIGAVSSAEEDAEEVLDENTDGEPAGIRAETPVRPLGSQFLDTFRT